jgi:aspartyl-tRNA synthetase
MPRRHTRRFIDELKRTHRCGELRASDIGEEVVLFGWVQYRRDHGGLRFIDLRDRDGITQVVFDPDVAKPRRTRSPRRCAPSGSSASAAWCASRGMQWSKKKGKMVSAHNPKLATGEVEVLVQEATGLQPRRDAALRDRRRRSTRARRSASSYRYLDLRRPPLQRTLSTATRSTRRRATTSPTRAASSSRRPSW